VVFAPGTPRQAFHLTNKAFDLAEKYQVPAVVLFDTFFADSQWTVDGLDTSRLCTMDYRIRSDAFRRLPAYKRHAFSESGISLLAVPGDGPHVVVADSDEHDEEGHIVEDSLTRIKMVEKRLLKKLPLIRREIAAPFLYGDHTPRVVIAGWGSTYGVMKEVVDRLSSTVGIAMLHFSEIFPMPRTERFDYLSFLKNAKLAVCIENNASGQFARLVRAETGFQFPAWIHKFDGRPFGVEDVIGELNGHLGRL
jgi:2-oxoglutarate/2-oxoacid ferredoxin oxidoreductase subunit alpha